jgi:hypothetical protein
MSPTVSNYEDTAKGNDLNIIYKRRKSYSDVASW